MLLQSPASYSGFATNMAANPEKPAYYPHTMPEHGSEIVDKGKWQQSNESKTEKPQVQRTGNGEKAVPMQHVVFVNRQTKQLLDALGNPNHKYRHRALQAVRRFTAAVEKDMAQDLIKDKGIVMEHASRKYGVPASTLRGWETMGLLTVLYRGRGKQGVYYNEEDIARAAPIYHEAKQRGEQPAKILKAMRTEEEEEGNSNPSS